MADPGPARRGPRQGRAVLAILVVTVLWGWTFVWMKEALAAARAVGAARGASGEAAPPFLLAAAVALFMTLRFGLASLLLPVAIPAAARGLDRRVWQGGFVLAALLLAGFLLQMLGLDRLTPPVSAFLTSLYVLFTALLSAGLARRRPGPLLGLGVVLATFGAGFVGGPPRLSFSVAEWLTVAGALVFALHILATDAVTRRMPPLPVTFTCFLWVTAGSAILLLGAWSTAGVDSGLLLAILLEPDFHRPLVLSAVLATVVALALMNTFQRELHPVRAAVLYALEPVWAAAIAIPGGHDRPRLWLFVGGAALLAGNLAAEAGPLLAARRLAARERSRSG